MDVSLSVQEFDEFKSLVCNHKKGFDFKNAATLMKQGVEVVGKKIEE